MAQQKGLTAFALTDHDSVKGIREAMDAAEGTGIEVVPGIEFSTEYEGHDIHIVGLYYDWKDPDFVREVQVFTEERTRRNQAMLEKMAADGLPVSYEELAAENPGSVITRANIARYLMNHQVVHSIKEAFDRLIGDGGPYFIPRRKISPEQAIGFTLRYHGIPILAHPFQYDLGGDPMPEYVLPSSSGDPQEGRVLSPAHTEKITQVTTGLDQLLQRLKSAGLVGIEAYYCRHTPAMTQQIRRLAHRYQLLLSGGSDFHGDNKPGLQMGTGYGHLAVPEELLLRMKHYLYHVTAHTKIFFSDFDGTLGTSEKVISPLTRKALDDFVARGRETLVPPRTGTPDPDFIVPEFADNNIFVLSSGRSMSDVKNLASRLHLGYSHMYLSGYNGAELYSCDTGVTFMRKTIPLPAVRRILALAKECGIYCHSYDGDDIVVQSAEDAGVSPARSLTSEEVQQQAAGHLPTPLSPENPASLPMLDPGVPYDSRVTAGRTENVPSGAGESAASDCGDPAASVGGDFAVYRAHLDRTGRHLQKETAYYTTYVKLPVRLEQNVADALSEEPCKCLAIHLENPQDHKLEVLQQKLRDEFGSALNLVLSNPYYLEIDAKGATKGDALLWLCRYLGIDTGNAIAAGDAPNDIPMIRAAGTGIGMCNGVEDAPEIAKAADLITRTDNDHDGLAPVLETL